MKTVDQIISLGAAFFGVKREILLSRLRIEDTCLIRFSIMAACRDQGYTLSAIGSAFNRDHKAVLHGLRNLNPNKFRNRWKDHEGFNRYLSALQDKVDPVEEAARTIRTALEQIDAKITALQAARAKLAEAQENIETASKMADVEI